MSWSWYSQLTDSFKRRAGRYLINRYLGPFLEEGILLDQLSIDEGITLRNVAVNTDHINSMLEDTEAPIEFVDGFIQELAVTVPWSNLLKDNCFFQIRGLTVTAQVKKRAHPSQLSASIFHSMCESFSSKDVAEDCLREQNQDDDSQEQYHKSELPKASSLASEESALGVEVLAQAIDSILMRVQVSFSDTTFRLEYVPTVAPRGLALEIKIGSLNYCGSIADDLQPAQMTSSTLKKISFQDVTLRTDEFSFHKSDHDQIMHRSSVGSTEDSNEELEDDDLKPLIMASLKGKQELILRFVDTDHYGLPRSVEEVEINVGPLIIHAFPHQIHTLLEIIGAFSSTSSDNLKPPSSSSGQSGVPIKFGLESMLQESMYHKPLESSSGGRGGGWSMGDAFESSTMSTDFQPMPKSNSQKRSDQNTRSSISFESNPATETPVIKIKASSIIAVLLEMDEGVSKMGGQSNKVSGFDKMQNMASKFFSQLEPPSVTGIWDVVRQAKYHDQIKQVCDASRLQIVGAPLNLTYEESNTSFAAGASNYNLQDFLMKLVLSIGRLSIKEVIEVDNSTTSESFPANFSHCDIDVVRFQASSSTVDFKLVYQECPASATTTFSSSIGNKTRLNIDLSPCALTLDPGFVDRIYMLFCYSEMDPTCLITPVSAATGINLGGCDEQLEVEMTNSLNVAISCPQLDLDFFVPKVDMRKPADIPTPEFVSLFWMRKVHPELFQMRLRQFEMILSQESGGPKSPLSITFSADFMDILFQETQESDKIPLAVARKSQRNSARPEKVAVKISVTVCMDESQKLQGRFDSAATKGQQQSKSFSNFENSEQFFGKAAGLSGDVRFGSSRGHKIVDEQGHIKAALEHSLLHHNIMVDLVLDEVSLVLPNKHVYEVIYNRLGNDMLLWLPAIFSVKDVLYNQPLPDPLRDPDQEFSHCLSGLTRPTHCLAIENRMNEEGEGIGEDHDETSAMMNRSIYQSFPKTNSKSGGLRIHTDTCVSLKLNKGHVCIASSSPMQQGSTSRGMIDGSDIFFFVGVIDKLKLLTAVGLERDPEICLLSLNVQDAKMYFGPAVKSVHDCNSHEFAAKLHFNEFPSPKVMPLFRSSTFKTRVWPSGHEEQELLGLTTKILFDSQNNFKSITLALFLCEGSIVASTPEAILQPVLADWLAEFFTVVEYPVLGYIPPAILTEMYFDLKHCTLDLTYLTPGQITLSLGQVKVTMCLIDTGNDLNITIAAEDLGVFLSKNETAVSHLKSSICVLDIDSFDISVELRETKPPGSGQNILDVNAAVQLLRIRTCNDTLVLLASLIASLSSSATSDSSAVSSREASIAKEMEVDMYEQQQMPEDVVPDIADAMAELEASEADAVAMENVDSNASKGKSKMAKTKGGAQVFFFPDENQKVLEQFGMSDSIYVESCRHHASDPVAEDHDFCILDDIGSAFGSKPNQPTVKFLNSSQSVSLIENHFAMTKEKSNLQIDYLKTPKGFPKFQSRITLKNLSLLWQIYGGTDFTPVTQGSINQQQSRGERGNQNNTEALKTRGGPDRQDRQLLEIFLSKISAQHEVYLGDSREASRQILLIRSFEIRDKLENSDINKLLHLYSNKLRPRQSNANMLSLKCVNLRPDPDMPTAEESVVNVTLQPLRINIDQETLFFIVNFCTAFIPDSGEHLHQEPPPNAATSSTAANPSHVNTIKYDHHLDSVEIQEVAQEAFESQHFQGDQETEEEVDAPIANTLTVHGARRDGDLYIRSFTFARDVPIRIDYSAKYMDLAHGAIPGILAGLTSLNCSELTLKKVHYKNGISGVDKLLTLLITDWLADIRQNQIPAILGGVGPMHSFLQLVQGVKDLFIMPVEQYNKDGRILRGIQKGAHSFTSLTAMSLLDFTNKLLGVIKFAAEMAFDIMSPETSVVQGKLPHPYINRQAATAHMRRRPADMREGMFNALAVIQEGMEETARTVIQNVIEDHNRRGLTGAVGGIIRQVPSNLVRPVILASAATSNVLEGVKNQVAPDARQEEEEKWKNT